MGSVGVLRSNAQGGARISEGFVELFERWGVVSAPELSNFRARQVNEYGPRRFGFDINAKTLGQLVQLENAWERACGSNLRLAFTPEGADDVDAIEGCFVQDSFETVRTGPQTWSIAFEFEEVP